MVRVMVDVYIKRTIVRSVKELGRKHYRYAYLTIHLPEEFVGKKVKVIVIPEELCDGEKCRDDHNKEPQTIEES